MSSSSGGGSGVRRPSVLTPEEIKSIVLNFITSRSTDKGFNVRDLTKESIYMSLKETEGISKLDIHNALVSLLNDKVIKKQEFHYTIYIPPSRIENISDEDKEYMTNFLAQLAIGFYFLFVLLMLFDKIPMQLANFFGLQTDNSKFLVFSIVGAIFSYYAGQKFLTLMKLINKFVPGVIQYRNIIIPIFIFLIPIIIFLFGFLILNETPTMTNILTSIAIIMTGMFGWLNYSKDKK